jgi:hypothetical protein
MRIGDGGMVFGKDDGVPKTEVTILHQDGAQPEMLTVPIMLMSDTEGRRDECAVPGKITVLFHSTSRENASSILREGFRDSTGNFMTSTSHTGVWFSDVPLDENEGVSSEALPRVSVNFSEDELSEYEWVEHCKGYREWLVPASVIAAHATIIEIVARD